MKKRKTTKGKKTGEQKIEIAKQDETQLDQEVQTEGETAVKETLNGEKESFTVAGMLETVRNRQANGLDPIVNGEREWLERQKEKYAKAVENLRARGYTGARVHRRKRWEKSFLFLLSRSGNVTCSAVASGVSSGMPHERAKKNPEFARKMQQAIDESIDYLELCATQRATEGTLRPVYMKDENGVPKQIGAIREHSDRLLEFLLSAKRPEIFRQSKSQVDITTAGQALPAAQNAVIILPDNHRQDALPPAVDVPKLEDKK